MIGLFERYSCGLNLAIQECESTPFQPCQSHFQMNLMTTMEIKPKVLVKLFLSLLP